ncbi:MAG TPA: alkaline phosphatase [Burkholderiales bacterium]|nr:alkaline phosphatase [Burkholderiales bacterium]
MNAVLVLSIPTAAAQTPEEWFRNGRAAVERAKAEKPVTGRARNVILFVGDGMGISTVTAARILEGQQHGMSGEENQLSFEKMPYVALSKTYSSNQQTPDSAPTMTAIVTGIKTADGLISVSDRVARGDFRAVAANRMKTILERAAERGMATGVVTTTRITHATPAACYAHSPDRDWESDADQPDAANEAGFPDIARQLVEFSSEDGLEVALGGGRGKFMPRTAHDPEYPEKAGERRDGRDLTKEWQARFPKSAYVWNKAQLDAVDPKQVRHLLGLFQPSHMQFEHDRGKDAAGEPSLAEMTGKALDILSQHQKGYFLMVEGGRIDHAHHAGNAYRALTDTIEFARAVKLAMERTDARDTLIVVTADHSHTFTIAGYPKRGNPILGKVVEPGHPTKEYAQDALGLPYTTLGYANGPGYAGASVTQPEGSKKFPHHGPGFRGITQGRPDLTNVDTTAPDYMQESSMPAESETHGGEDVAIYARGPQAYLVRGVMEQNVIFHIMADALGMQD